MREEWADIEGYEGLYQISTHGRVKNVAKSRLLKPCKHRTGYLTVMLYKNGAYKRVLIHRLVASAFLPKDSSTYLVNHKDENKENNILENLEWCTREYNMNYGDLGKRLSIKRGSGARNKKPVCQIDMNGEIIQVWESIASASRNTGTARTSIYECCRGIHKTANGFKWEYEKDERINGITDDAIIC